jgi:teichoic acid transport system permease protein
MWDVHVPPGNVAYFRSVWSRREYMMYSASNELQSRQMTSVLGNLWHLLNPLLQIGVYFLVFGVVIGVNRGDNYFAFLSIGIFVFGFTQRSTMSGSSSITNNKGLLNAFSFPRALLPITSTLTEAMATLAPIIVIYVVAVVSGETPALRWLVLPLFLAVQLVFNFGAAMLAARATNSVSDLNQVLPFVFRILLYVSGVLFDVRLYAEGKSWEWLFQLNPIFCIVTLTRWSILGGDYPAKATVVFLVWTVVVAVVGLVWFRAGEGSYGRE